MTFHLRPPWWRGALVALAWLLWPLLAFFVDLAVRFSTSTTRGCSIEGCDFTPTLWELFIYLLPPLVATTAWWWWRRGRGDRSS